jgi:hypothetical protein
VPFDFALATPPHGLTIPAAELPRYLRAAFGLWVTELRPALRRALPGCDCGCGEAGTCGCGCHGASGDPQAECDDDAVLLAEIDVALAPGDALVAADDGSAVDDGARPYLLHTRLLQEWLLTGGIAQVEGSPPTDAPTGSPIADVTAHPADSPAARWDPGTRVLDLGIPPGAGIDDVELRVLPPGTPPSVLSFENRVLTLGIGPGEPGRQGEQGEQGEPGLGIRRVEVERLDPGTQPQVDLTDGILILRIPAGERGEPGTGDETLRDQPRVVAAGSFGPRGGSEWSYRNLSALSLRTAGLFFMRFDEFAPDAAYVIKGTAVTRAQDTPIHTVEVVPLDDEIRQELDAADSSADPERGFFLRAIGSDLKSRPLRFMVEVSDYTRVL